MNFGSCAIEYAGDFELVTNNTLYFMYKKATQISNITKKKNN